MPPKPSLASRSSIQTFTLALVTGQSVVDVSQHVFANLRPKSEMAPSTSE
jgi:hypothetical protein